MSDIRFNQWLHQSGTGGVSQVASGAVGVGTTNPLSDFYVRGDAQITGILTAGHISLGSSITFGDDDRIYLGDGTDFQLYHASSDNNSYIVESGAGSLVVNASSFHVKNAANNEDIAKFSQSGNNELYFSNSKKFETTNTGAVVTGILTATTFVGALTGTASGNATVSNNANNRVITGGSGNALNGESNLTFDGNQLSVTTGNSANPLFVNSTYGNTKLIVRETTNGNSNAGIQIQKRHSSLHPANHWYGDISFLGWDGSGYHRAALIECVAEGTPANDNMPGNLIFSTNPGQASQVEALRISKTGLVGINQSTPTERLHVVGNAIVTGMIMAGDGTTSNCAYANNGDSHTGMYFPANDNVSLSTAGTQRFLIESNGIVKIGNSVGNYYSNDLVLKCAANAGGITIGANGTSDANFINFADATSSPGYLAGGIKYRHDTDAFIIRAGHEEKVEVQTSGNLKINDGDLVVGTSGHGIDFSATADGAGGGMWNEKLSDYETGTFTPVTYGWGTATPYSGSSYNAGWYVRVGAVVHVGWKVYYNTLSGSNSQIGVGGFPFNSAGNHQSIAAARFDVPETAVTYDLIFYMGSSDNKVWLYQKNSSGGISAINSSGNRSNCWTFGQVTYYVT